MNDEQIRILKSMFKTQDKLCKLINRIRKLPDVQKKKIEVMLGGPMDDEELDAEIKKYKEMKQKFEMEFEK
jgi:hypothetical protein